MDGEVFVFAEASVEEFEQFLFYIVSIMKTILRPGSVVCYNLESEIN